jgi:hypothetical protein
MRGEREKDGAYKIWGMVPIDSRLGVAMDVVRWPGVDQVRALHWIFKGAPDNFEVYTGVVSFPEALHEAVAGSEGQEGVTVHLVDFDDTFRERGWEELLGRFGKVDEEELERGREVNAKEGHHLIVWSDQPRRGLQVARVLRSIWKKMGRGYQCPPECFSEAGILWLASETHGPFYFIYKNREDRLAQKHVGWQLNGKFGMENVGRIVVYGDRVTDVMAAASLANYLGETYGYSGPVDCYWLLGREMEYYRE